MNALTQKTMITGVDITANGSIIIKLLKQVLTGNTVISVDEHRRVIYPGDDLQADLLCLNSELASIGAAPVDSSAWASIVVPVASAVWSPDVVTSYLASIDKTF